MGSAPTNRVLWPSLVVSPGHIEATWETQESVVAIPDPIHTCKDGNDNNNNNLVASGGLVYPRF